jgi:hypothetical protein
MLFKHEAVHIGVGTRIVKRYRLSHWASERIVDRFVLCHFHGILPDYPMQDMPDVSIDAILADPEVQNSLPERVEALVLTRANK